MANPCLSVKPQPFQSRANGCRRRFAGGTARPVEGQTVGAVWNGSSSHQICWNTWLSNTRVLKKRLLHCGGGNCHRLMRGLRTHFLHLWLPFRRMTIVSLTFLIYASWASTHVHDLRDWIARWVEEKANKYMKRFGL